MPFCNNCGTEVHEGSTYCSRCGAYLGTPMGFAGYGNPLTKDEGLVLILSLVPALFGIMGIGQIYMGRLLRGIMFMIVGFLPFILMILLMFGLSLMSRGDPGPLILLIIIGPLIYLVVLAIQTWDAWELVKEWNRAVARTSQEPW